MSWSNVVSGSVCSTEQENHYVFPPKLEVDFFLFFFYDLFSFSNFQTTRTVHTKKKEKKERKESEIKRQVHIIHNTGQSGQYNGMSHVRVIKHILNLSFCYLSGGGCIRGATWCLRLSRPIKRHESLDKRQSKAY